MVSGDVRTAFVVYVEAEDEFEAIKKTEAMTLKELEAHGTLDEDEGATIDCDYAEETDA